MIPAGRVLAVAAAVALASAAAAPRSARAEERRRIAILDVVIEGGDAPPELRAQLDRSLAGGLYAGGWEVVTREEVQKRLRGAPELSGCMTTTCLERIGELVGARRFVRARVEASGATYAFELELYGADVSGGVVHRVERSCSVCTLAEANDQMSRAAAELRDEAGRVTVVVRTEPPGAAVEIDGAPAGTSPLEAMLAPGTHAVRATLGGRLPAETTLMVAPQPEGSAQEVALTLAPEGQGRDRDRGAESRFGAWKWAAGAGGALALGAGIWLIAIDGGGVDCPGDGRPCREIYDTLAGGVALTVAGAALGGATVWMFLHDRPARERAVAVTPLRGGGGAVVVRLAF